MSHSREFNKFTIAFYNVENLFDTVIDPETHDNDFSMTSVKRWSKKRYDRKLYKLGSVISQIGEDELDKPPTIIGLAEAENETVLLDLAQSDHLKNYNYKTVHYDSLDERGIDVGFIYNADEFTVTASSAHSVYLKNDLGLQDYTRDILLVSGVLGGDRVHFIINHWPSRREGTELSSVKRLAAAAQVVKIVAELRLKEQDPKIVIMGDFNDNPNNESIQFLLKETSFFNPMSTLLSFTRGSVNHNFKWNLFDQFMISTNFFETSPATLKFEKADIFDKPFLTQYNGKFKGQPYRTYVGKKYMGGFSDHFPIYLILEKENDSMNESLFSTTD